MVQVDGKEILLEDFHSYQFDNRAWIQTLEKFNVLLKRMDWEAKISLVFLFFFLFFA